MIQNIKNTKSISLFALLFVVGLGLSLALSWRWALNYGTAFFSFIGVFSSLFFTFGTQLKTTNNEKFLENKKISFAEKMAIGSGVFFSSFRIFAYAFLSFALIALLEFDLFNIYAYFMGIFFALLCVILILLFKNIE